MNHLRRTSRSPGWGGAFSPADKSGLGAGRLLTMELELSRSCDLRCIYCYAGSGLALDEELGLDELRRVADEARGLGARKIVVLGGGEPLNSPHLVPLLDHLRGLGVDIELFTNGVRLDRAMAELLAGLGASVVVKMNSLRPEVQDLLAGKAGAFRAIRAGLDCLREAGYPGPGRKLGAQTVICRHNLAELPAMWRWLRSRGIIPYFESITLQGRARAHPELLVAPEELHAALEGLAGLDAREFGIAWEPHPPVAAFNCDRHEYSCTVTAAGGVLPCPGVDIEVGNVRRAPLGEILAASPVIRDLRNVRARIKGACRDCDLAAECYGCRGMAYQATGDYLAADPLCRRTARAAASRNGD
ncbi:MAG: radical SAM protein [Thermodesulfobacteriota bacterium]